jgi:hypothetical protein
VSLDHKQHAGGQHTSGNPAAGGHGAGHAAGGHAHAAGHDAHDASHDHAHDAEVEETLAPDEQPTPLWLPVVGALLFFAGFILIAAF